MKTINEDTRYNLVREAVRWSAMDFVYENYGKSTLLKDIEDGIVSVSELALMFKLDLEEELDSNE